MYLFHLYYFSCSELRIAEDTWKKLAESEARLHLMVELGELEVGFLDVEQFLPRPGELV